jgi:hypothetical protein
VFSLLCRSINPLTTSFPLSLRYSSFTAFHTHIIFHSSASSARNVELNNKIENLHSINSTLSASSKSSESKVNSLTLQLSELQEMLKGTREGYMSGQQDYAALSHSLKEKDAMVLRLQIANSKCYLVISCSFLSFLVHVHVASFRLFSTLLYFSF